MWWQPFSIAAFVLTIHSFDAELLNCNRAFLDGFGKRAVFLMPESSNFINFFTGDVRQLSRPATYLFQSGQCSHPVS